MNELFIAPLFLYCTTLSGVKYRFTEFPSFWELFSQLMTIYIIEDSFFYWGHRMFHTFPQLYKLHKIHHEYDKVFTFSTEYFHPVDFVLGNIVSLHLFSCHLPWDSCCYRSRPTALLLSSGYSGKFYWELRLTQDTSSRGVR